MSQPETTFTLEKATADRLEAARALTQALLASDPRNASLHALAKAFGFMQGDANETAISLRESLHPILVELIDEFEVSKIPFADLLRKVLSEMPQEQTKAVWSAAYVNDLPDSAFLYIAPGGEKDPEGKTTPRSNRYFPYRDSDGVVDLPHLRNAIARIPQANIPDGMKPGLQDRARQILERENARLASEAKGIEKALLFGPSSNGNQLVITDTGVASIDRETAWRIKNLCHPLMMLSAAYPESLELRALCATLMGLEPEDAAEMLRCAAVRALGELLPLSADINGKLPELSLLLNMARPILEAIATMVIPEDMFEDEGMVDEMAESRPSYHAGWRVHQMARIRMRAVASWKADLSTGNLAADGGLKNPSQGGAMLTPGRGKRKKSDLPPASVVAFLKKNPAPFAATPEANPQKPTDLPQAPTSIAGADTSGGEKEKPPFPGAAPLFHGLLESTPVTLMLEAAPPASLALLALVDALKASGHPEQAGKLDKMRITAELAYQKAIASVKTAGPTAGGVGEVNTFPATTKKEDKLSGLATDAFQKAFGVAAPNAKPASDLYVGMPPLVAEVLKKHINFYKAAEERYVLGVVLEPETVDAQNDIISEETIRNACHKFMEEFQNMGLQHQFLVNGAVKILECFISPMDFKAGEQTIRKGTWVLAVRVLDDKLWGMVKAGELTGFSIGGMAYRVPDTGTAPA